MPNAFWLMVYSAGYDITRILKVEWRAAKEKAVIPKGKNVVWLFERRKGSAFTAEYTDKAIEDGDPAKRLMALRKVVEARGGLALIAERAHLSRETLHRTLSSR